MVRMFEELRLAARRLARESGFTCTVILTMAVGIGAVATVFTLVYGVLLRPLSYPEPHRLVSVGHVAPGIDPGRDGLSAGIYLHYRDENRVFDAIAGYQRVSFTFTDVGRPERIETALVTPELFSVLGVEPRLGRLPTAEDDTHDVAALTGTIGTLLSHDLWVERYDADPGIVGRALEIDGRPWAIVTGVAPEGFSFPDPQVEAWLATPQERVLWSDRAEVRRAMLLNGVARLRPGVTPEQAAADLDRLVSLLPEAFPDITAEEIDALGLRARVRPFKEVIVGDVRLPLLVVLASAGFLLLVTWANATNLLLMRAHARRTEIGITRALGAAERDVSARLLSESLLLAAIGGALGLGIAAAAVGSGLGFAPRQLPRLDEVGVDAVVVAVVAALVLVSGTLMGAICLVSNRRSLAGPALSALRSRSATEQRDGQKGRRALVAVQLALALTLLVGSSLMARTFWELQQVDLGFDTDERLTFYMPMTHLGLDASHQEHAALHAEVMDRLRALPAVEGVQAATASVFPLTLAEYGRENLTAITAPGSAAGDDVRGPLAEYGYATPGYFREMGIPVVAGRTFRSVDAVPGAAGAILSASLARDLFPDGHPVGQSVEFADFRSFWPRLTVVGVVGDVPATTLRDGGTRAIYLPHVHPFAPEVSKETLYPYTPRFEMYVVRTSTDPAALIPELRRTIDTVDPRLPMLDVAPLETLVAEAASQERFMLRLLLVSAAAALFLGIVGVYGVLAYAVRRRGAELGIRLALGATPGRVRRQVVGEGATLSIAGIVVGLAASLASSRFIEALLFETSPTDPLMFAGATLLLFATALAASYLPARRASRVDPAIALRSE